MSLRQAFSIGVALFALACSAERVSPDARGVSVEAGPCGRGLVVVESDYQSSNVSLLGFDGNVLSPSLLSSSTEGSGFGAALSGDVVPTSSSDPGPRLALIDRFAPGVLRFIDLANARVASELPVGTGFDADPQDYLALDAHKAYVARYQSNANPGRQDWDGGGDVLVVDPGLPAITGRIDLSPAMVGEAKQFTPHPARLLQIAGRVFALLASYANNYELGGTSSRLVELDPGSDGIVSTLVLDGLRGCDALAVSPEQTELAVACTGDDLGSAVANDDRSGLVLVDVSGTPVEKRRFAARSFGDAPVGFSVDYAASSVLLFSTFGHSDESGAIAAQDTLWRLDTVDGSHEAVLHSLHTPFTLGSIRCAPHCGACFAADAERGGGSVLRFALDSAATLSAPTLIRAEARVGLPPRYLSAF